VCVCVCVCVCLSVCVRGRAHHYLTPHTHLAVFRRKHTADGLQNNRDLSLRLLFYEHVQFTDGRCPRLLVPARQEPMLIHQSTPGPSPGVHQHRDRTASDATLGHPEVTSRPTVRSVPDFQLACGVGLARLRINGATWVDGHQSGPGRHARVTTVSHCVEEPVRGDKEIVTADTHCGDGNVNLREGVVPCGCACAAALCAWLGH
jgi:hypothetical protein